PRAPLSLCILHHAPRPELHPPSLHDALPISDPSSPVEGSVPAPGVCSPTALRGVSAVACGVSAAVASAAGSAGRSSTEVPASAADRKSTRLHSSHVSISYAVFCLKKQPNNAG